MSAPSVTTLPRALPSDGTQTPMVRHVIERKRENEDAPWEPWGERALCGYVWDRPFVSADGPWCDACLDVLKKRHEG